jgi:sugar (pentulose or hexulose) kinase
LRHQHPAVFSRVKYALHLPQYLAFTLHGNVYSDITSIGCHTNLWDFQNQQYHAWVKNEGIEPKLAPIIDSQSVGGFYRQVPVGIGLHDSSAALIPYLVSVAQPFVLLSTGTWCITLNPFNQTQLSDFELHQDCLCFISYKNKAVKASRLFAGYEHEQQIKRLATYFNKPTDYYTTVQYDSALLATDKFTSGSNTSLAGNAMIGQSFFLKRELATFENYEAAYHQLIADLVALQIHSTQIVLNGFAVKQLFVDGGFSNNPVYMQLLANAFPQYQVMAAKLPQATALGAALSMHQHWNSIAMPSDIISFKYYIPKKT